jgi:transcription initiation factor TFIID subunit 1, fungi type
VQSYDFLLTRTAKRTNWYIREIPALYAVGQIQPKVTVKTPNARDANAALKDMLSVFIFRLLRQNPKYVSVLSFSSVV